MFRHLRRQAPGLVRALAGSCLCLLLSAMAGQAQAAVYCVATASGLSNAMTSANNGDEGSVQDIRVRPGTYSLPAGLKFDPAGNKDNKDFSLTGGWNSDCSSRTINPAATVLDGGGDALFMFWGDHQRIVVEGLRFTNFNTVGIGETSCQPYHICSDTQAIRVRFNEFRSGRSVWVSTYDAQFLNVSNNLIANISNAPNAPHIKISYANNESPPIIAFNTFANIQCTASDQFAVELATARTATVHHNIFHSNGCGSDVNIEDFFNTSFTLRNNLYGTRSGMAPVASSGNVISSNPGFLNAAAGDYRLKESVPASAAINAGLSPAQMVQFGLAGTIPSQDLDGPAGVRLTGTRYDIGAYESTVNDASVLVVTSSNDSGAGSLRAALESANASPGLQKIHFNIPGICPRLVSLQSPLPDIVDSVEIDGFTQPGSAPNTKEIGTDAELCLVVLSQSSTLSHALRVPDAAPANTSLALKGVALAGATGFNGNFTVALSLRGGRDHLIQGNAFAGTGPGAIGPLGTLVNGIVVRGVTQNALIGGSAPEHRNSFGAMTNSAIVLNDAGSSGHLIQNNYIGLSASGLAASPNGLNGISASNSPDVRIEDNTIAASSNGIFISGATALGYQIRRNRIGTSANGIPGSTFRNGTGITISNGSGLHDIGGYSAQSNLIVNSEGAGVRLTGSAGSGTSIRPNRIFGNGLVHNNAQGIDLGDLGPLPNDPGDPDQGPNGLQNWPQILYAWPNADGTWQVAGELHAQPGTYLIDLYRSPDCPQGRGQMDQRISLFAVTVNSAAAPTPFEEKVPSNGAGWLTATATRGSTGDTSEVSACYREKWPVTLGVGSSQPTVVFGHHYTVNVLASSAGGIPTGLVTIADQNTGAWCNATLNASGIASCQLLAVQLGQRTLSASLPGDDTFFQGLGSGSVTVVPAATTTSIAATLPATPKAGQPYSVQVEVRAGPGNQYLPDGSVTISDGAGASCQVAVLVDGNGSCQLNSTTAGMHTLAASYQGTPGFLASEGELALEIQQADTALELFGNGFE
jgi:trimeric autotransporter adhesin